MPINWNSPLAVSEPDPREIRRSGSVSMQVHFQLAINATCLRSHVSIGILTAPH